MILCPRKNALGYFFQKQLRLVRDRTLGRQVYDSVIVVDTSLS